MSAPGIQSLEGAWRTDTYTAGGSTTPVEGVLLFAAGRWSTLYFLPESANAGRRASAEAGRYEVSEERLTFHHELLFQGGDGRDVEMRTDADRHEVCRIAQSGESLTIRFPSGNSLRLRRA